MVAKFISVEDFAVRAGLGNVDDLADEVTAKAQASIEAATIHLISIIRTEFDAAVGIRDRYYIDVGEFPYVGEFPRLYLSQGFVSTAESAMQVRTASLLGDLTTSPALNTAYLVMDATKGTLLVTGTDRTNLTSPGLISGNRFFVDVTYDAGFAAESDAFGTIYTGAPDWLSEAAMILAKSIFDTGQPCKDNEKTGTGGCPCTIDALVGRSIRFMPSALLPMS